mgnify:CR=1 FL=1
MSHRTHGAPACPRASAPGTPEAGGTPSPDKFAHVSIAIRPSGICARRNSRPLNLLLFLMTCGLLHGLTARSPQPRPAQRHPAPFPPSPAMTLPAMTSPAMPAALRPHSPDDARLLRASLIAVWLITIAASLLECNGQSLALLRQGGVHSLPLAHALIAAGVALDAALALALIWRPGRAAYALAAASVIGLTLTATALLPALRMDGAGEDDGGARPSAVTGGQASLATWPALLRGFLAQPGAWRWLALLSGCFPLVGAAWVYLKPMLLGQGFAAEQVAWIVGVGGGALGAAASLLTGLLAPAARLPALLPRATWFGAAALAALAACLACQASAAWLIAASGWLACATGISASVAFGLMMERARPVCQAADYGLQASFFALGRLALMPLAGWLLDSAGSAALVAALAVASAGMAALAGRWMDALARGLAHQKKERIKAL